MQFESWFFPQAGQIMIQWADGFCLLLLTTIDQIKIIVFASFSS